MGFVPAVISALRGVFTTSGRAPRAEFWYFFLVLSVVQVFTTAALKPISPWSSMAVGWAMNLLFVTVTIRRGHDSGRPAWLTAGLLVVIFGGSMSLLLVDSTSVDNIIFVVVAPLVLLILLFYLFVLMLLPGNRGSNKYGPNPYAGAAQNPTP